MLNYCSEKANQNEKECACINSKLTKVGSPICIDKRCSDYGYKTTGMTKFKCNEFMTPFKCSQYYELKEQYPKDQVTLLDNQYTHDCLKNPQPFDVSFDKKDVKIDPQERRDNFIFYLLSGFILFILIFKYIYFNWILKK
jgi:hypothetical protein